MRGLLLRKFLATTTRTVHSSHILKPTTAFIPTITPIARKPPLLSDLFPLRVRYFSSENETPDSKPESQTDLDPVESKEDIVIEDVSNKDYKLMIEDYIHKRNDDALADIFDATLRRKITGKHEETDDELLDELQKEAIDNVDSEAFEDDFDEAFSTDGEVEDLYDTRDIVIKRLIEEDGGKQSIYSNETKWDELVKASIENGSIDDSRECEDLLEDMLKWDKLLPDEVKMKVEKKFDEIGERIEKGELGVEDGYALFKEFEDQVVLECIQMEEEKASQLEEDVVHKSEKESDDPPGEGPILRWETRVVFSPGGDAWHPKNRKVKLAVTVKELGLSKHQFIRLRELAGKRYDPAKGELTITSERFEHREENRKDCLRTLFDLIEEAGKARKMVERARIEDMKERLKANPAFMQRLGEAKKQQTGI